MAKKKARPNAVSGPGATGEATTDQPQAASAGTAAPDGGAAIQADGGGGGGDGAASPDPQVMSEMAAAMLLDPEMPIIDKQEENVMAARWAASTFVPGAIYGGPWDSALPMEAAIVLAAFFRIFPDSPDEAGPTELKRFKIDLPEEDRPGQLLAMIRVFRCALDQLDRLDREDAARAKALEPKPKPEQWREPKGFKLTKEAMKPGSGLKPR